MASINGEFVLHHVVEDVSSLQEGVLHFSHPEKHLDLNWYVFIQKKSEFLIFRSLKYCRVDGKLQVQLQPLQGDYQTHVSLQNTRLAKVLKMESW